MQLNPREQFTIARGLEDHTISTQFYVRATIRNARTDELLDTVNLVDSGDHHRYTYTWQTPADVSGEGFWILITTSVYTDSGYTTKSTTYGDKYDEYLVMQRVNPNSMGLASASVDYKKIQKMIDEAVGRLPTERPKEVDLSPIYKAISAVETAVSSIKIPEQKSVDLSGVINRIDLAIKAAENKEMTESQLRPLHDACESLRAAMEAEQEKLADAAQSAERALEKIQTYFSKDVEDMLGGINDIKKYFQENVAYVVMKKDIPLPPSEPTEED